MKKSLKIKIIILVIIILPIAWWLGSPLFIDKKVNEEFPINNEGNLNGAFEEKTNSVLSGDFQDADRFHKVSGIAKYVSDEDKTYLRFEDFESTNGPDLKVYLANDLEANDYINLGKLKGNIGNQNYEVTDINYENYKYVLVWCEAFSVLFGYAEINKSNN